MFEAQEIQIGPRKIGSKHKPFIIAEMSGNHNQSLERAIAIVDAVADTGADALKIQTYTSETMTMDSNRPEFRIKSESSLWNGETLYDLYKKAFTPWEWHKPIFDHCKKRGLIGFSTPFDSSAVDFLESLNVPCHKIASFENIDIPLIKKISLTGKPVIMSTGMATIAELDESVSEMRKNGTNEVVLLKCTSSYPSEPLNSNILTIPHMKQLFKTEIGLSDHTMGVGVATAAVALGATVIEKHFTLRRSDGGVDSAFSLEPDEMKLLVKETERAWQSLGNITYGPTESEMHSLQFRRSIYVSDDIKKGDAFTSRNLKVIRPANGLKPKFIDIVFGRFANQDIKKGTPLSWDHF